jgi:digeranylgeranylglycerophospholipid reductase
MRANPAEKIDAVVVGCGIAGASLAGLLARDGYSVVVLEKRPVIGVPVRCGEAAGPREEIGHFIAIDEAFVSADLNAVRVFGPRGSFFERRMSGFGVVLDRERFDQALADQARSRGADVRVHHEAVALTTNAGRVGGVEVENHDDGSRYVIESKITIGADGIEAFVGRWAGLTRHLRPSEIHAGAEYLLESEGLPGDAIELHAGQGTAPGGYAWVFPKGRRLANVGVGVHPGMTKDGAARDYLDRFVGERFPHAVRRRFVAGGISGSKPLKTMVGDGVLLVGEAARHNNPLSGGGIMNSLEGAEEAYKVIANALAENDTSTRALKPYDEAWHSRNGRSIYKFALLRELFFRLDDEELAGLVTVLGQTVGATEGAITDYTEIFRIAFKRTPGMLWKMGRVLW